MSKRIKGWRWETVALGLMLSACVRADRPAPPPAEAPPRFGIHAALADRIEFETGACFGRCPVYRVSLSRDGEGVFTGLRFTQVLGERRFRVDPQVYRDFALRLARVRPDRDTRIEPGAPGCEHAPTDLPGITLHFNRGQVDPASLYLYYGCREGRFGAMIDTISAAIDALPLTPMVGEQP